MAPPIVPPRPEEGAGPKAAGGMFSLRLPRMPSTGVSPQLVYPAASLREGVVPCSDGAHAGRLVTCRVEAALMCVHL